MGPNRGFKTDIHEGLHVGHCTTYSRPYWERKKAGGMLIVTTQRNWEDVRGSWDHRRQLDPSELPKFIRNYFDWVLPMADIVVSVDFEREARLMHLEDLLGVPLNTDWEPVNSRRNVPR